MKEKPKNKIENESNEDDVISINLQAIVILLVIIVLIIAFFICINIRTDSYINKEGNDVLNYKTNTKNEDVEFNESDAISVLKDYLELKALASSNPQAVLEKYGFATNQQFAKYERTADETFIKTDISYEEIRNKFQEFITKDFFNKEYKNIYKSSNGVTYVANKNDAKINYEITRYEKNENKNKPILQVWYKTTLNEVTSEEKNMKVEYNLNNSKWIISNIN